MFSLIEHLIQFLKSPERITNTLLCKLRHVLYTIELDMLSGFYEVNLSSSAMSLRIER